MPRIITTAVSTSGSSTLTIWKRRASAGSFSMCFLYSLHVVAPTVRSSPRASAGLSRLAASPVPAAPPAPTSVCVSSMNRMVGLGASLTASMTAFMRASNSPLTPAPAWSEPRSSAAISAPLRLSGTSPAAIRRASPSTTAVLPTPASPTRIGLFLRRRDSTSITWRISRSRPKMGSMAPSRAFCVSDSV